MPIDPSTRTVEETYRGILSVLRMLKQRLPGLITQYTSAVTINALTDSLIPTLRDASGTCPDVSGYPQEWVDALNAHAAAQMPLVVGDFVTDYQIKGSAIRAALAAALDALPVDGEGYVLGWQFDAAGVDTVRALTAQDVAPVKAALEALQAALG